VARARKGSVKTRSKAWEYQVGEPPNTVTAYERVDRGRIVMVRWWIPEKKAFRRRSLGMTVRDERGVVDPELQREAVALTQRWYDDLMAGRSPTVPDSNLEDGEEPSEDGDAEDVGPLSVERGFAIATSVPKGLYVVETEHLREVRRAARDIVWAIGTDDLGRTRTWDGLRYSHVRELWIRLAKRYVDTKQGGAAWTERCVVIFLQVSTWLAIEEKIDRVVTVKKTWRSRCGASGSSSRTRGSWRATSGTPRRRSRPSSARCITRTSTRASLSPSSSEPRRAWVRFAVSSAQTSTSALWVHTSSAAWSSTARAKSSA
jgi:hypothetical protein